MFLVQVVALRFTPQPRTEASNQPDFIFPGEREYHDATFNAALLVMLGVKSTSKDRWRGARRSRRFTVRVLSHVI
ncbi:MAG TPA: type II restriction endonuclease [Candidatus Angelobacter sp.]|nr:type II restriction endonuclease [Candidatus Angelobacter sp.]